MLMKVLVLASAIAFTASCTTSPRVVLSTDTPGSFRIRATEVHNVLRIAFLENETYRPRWVLVASGPQVSKRSEEKRFSLKYSVAPPGFRQYRDNIFEPQKSKVEPLPEDEVTIIQVTCTCGYWFESTKTWQFYYLDGRISTLPPRHISLQHGDTPP